MEDFTVTELHNIPNKYRIYSKESESEDERRGAVQAQHEDEEEDDSEEVKPGDLEGLITNLAGSGNSTNEEWGNIEAAKKVKR